MSTDSNQPNTPTTDEYQEYCIQFARAESDIPDDIQPTLFKDLSDAVFIEWENGKSSYMRKDFILPHTGETVVEIHQPPLTSGNTESPAIDDSASNPFEPEITLTEENSLLRLDDITAMDTEASTSGECKAGTNANALDALQPMEGTNVITPPPGFPPLPLFDLPKNLNDSLTLTDAQKETIMERQQKEISELKEKLKQSTAVRSRIEKETKKSLEKVTDLETMNKLLRQRVAAAENQLINEVSKTDETSKINPHLERMKEINRNLQDILQERTKSKTNDIFVDEQTKIEERVMGRFRQTIREEVQVVLDAVLQQQVQVLPPVQPVAQQPRPAPVSKNNDDCKNPPPSSDYMLKENPKLKFMLERGKKNFKIWKQMLITELSLKRLGDLVDPSIEPYCEYTEPQMRERCAQVKGIILAHLAEEYQEMVIEMKDPREIVERLARFKREEINDTTLSIIDKINHLKYDIKKESFVDFDRRFDALVRKYELVAGCKLDAQVHQDAYYRAVAFSVPDVKTATYTDRARGVGNGFSVEELRRFATTYESEHKSVSQVRQGGAMYVNQARDGQNVCNRCGDVGHVPNMCPNPDGFRRCYNCLQMTNTHIGRNCPTGEEENWNEEEKSSAKANLEEAAESDEGSPSSPSAAPSKVDVLQTVIKTEPGTDSPPADRVEACESVIKKAGSVNELDSVAGTTSPGAGAVAKTASPPVIKIEPIASPVPSAPTPNEPEQYVGVQPQTLQSALTGTRYYSTVTNAVSDSRYRPEPSDTRQGYLCPPCGIRFSSFSTLEAHQTFYCSHRLKKISKGGTESEGEEGRASSVTGGYDQDDGSSGENMSSSEPSAKVAKTGKQYRCTHCSYSADKKVSLNRHMRMHSVSPATSVQNDSDSSVPPVDRYCQECDIRFSNLKTFRAHKMHYCSTRNVIKRPSNTNSSPSSNVSVESRISPPLPFGLPNQISAQPFVALPTNPVLIIPYAIIQGGSMLSGSVTSNLSTQDGVYILLQDGSIQMVAQGISSQPARLPESSSPVLQPLSTANTNQVRKENISPKAAKPVPTIPVANGALDLRTRRESHSSESTTTIDASEEEKENRLIDEHTDHEDIVCAPSIPLILSTSSTSSTPSPIPLSPESHLSSMRSDRRLCSPSPKSSVSKSSTSKKLTNGVIQKCSFSSKVLDTLGPDDKKSDPFSSQSISAANSVASAMASTLDRNPNYSLTEMILAAASQNPESLKELQLSSAAADMLPHLSALQQINAAAAAAAAVGPNASGKRAALNPIANIPLLLPPVSPGSRVLPDMINPSILPLLTSELAMRLGTVSKVQPGMPQYVRQGSWKCEDCTISFCKYENYVAHKKHYCSTRKVPESTPPAADDGVTNCKTSPLGSPPTKTTPSPQAALAKENTSPAPQPINVIQNARHYSQQFVCSMCGIKFTSLDNLSTHQTFYCPNRVTLTESEKSSLKCPKCKMLLPADQLPSHQCTSISSPNWKCPSCFVVCTSTNAIQKHVESHTGVKGFLCTICNYKGGTIRGMRTHIRVHFDKRNGDVMEENFITYIMDDTASNASAASSATDETSSDRSSAKKSPPAERLPSSSPLPDAPRAAPIPAEQVEDEDEYIEVDELPNLGKPEVKSEPQDIQQPKPDSKCSPPPQPADVIVVDDLSTSSNNNNNNISNHNKKYDSKYCKSCDISFNYLSTFIAHKKYYCSSQSSSTSSSSPPPASAAPMNGAESIVVPANLATAAHIV